MKTQFIRRVTSFLAALFLCGSCNSGGGDNGNTPGTGTPENPTLTSTFVYHGPSPYYSLTRDKNTFILEKRAAFGGTLQWSATGSVLTSMSMRVLKVEATQGAGAPALNSHLFALEVPGLAAFLRISSQGPILPLVLKGGCLTGNFDGNWVASSVGLSGESPNNDSDRFFGYFTYDFTSTIFSLSPGFNLSSLVGRDGTDPGPATCQDGFVLLNNGETGYTNEVGSAVLDLNGKHIVALPKTTFSDSDIEGSYTGFIYTQSQSEALDFASATIQAKKGTVYKLTQSDLESEKIPPTPYLTFDYSNTDDPQTGFFKGVVRLGSSTGNLACHVYLAKNFENKKVIHCSAQDVYDNSQMINMVLMSR